MGTQFSNGGSSNGASTRVYEKLLFSFMGCRSADEALSAETSLLKTILVSLPTFIYVKDLNSQFVLSNPAHLQVLGCASVEQVLGKNDFDYFPREEAMRYFEDEQQLLKTGDILLNREEPVTCASGEHLWGLTTKVPLRDEHGRIFGLVGVTRDITDRKKAEENLKSAYAELECSQRALNQSLKDLEISNAELSSTQMQLIHAAKLESLGVLSAAVAHEVKNPLQTILMGVDYLERNQGAAACSDVLKDMREAVMRARLILGELLNLARSTELTLAQEDLNQIVQRALWLIRFELMRSRIKVILDLGSNLPNPRVDKAKLEQALINLLTNALHAMPDGGVLAVRTKLVPPDSGKVAFPLLDQLPHQGGCPLLFVEIKDTGPGIPAKNMPKIFDPFFTTKPPGVGTGLGLSIVRKIIELHGGAVRIENVEPRGVSATLILKGG